MYTEQDRETLLHQLTSKLESFPEIEGLLLMGSGASGFADLYSDIDLMAGCWGPEAAKALTQPLYAFCKELGPCHIEPRSWTPTVLGMSVYYANGLSFDLSYMPTSELVVRAPQIKILFSKSDAFTAAAKTITAKASTPPVPYPFLHELRYAEIALRRNNLIYADIALSRARQILLDLQTAAEGKKLHQFKAYNTLNKDFLTVLEGTYPQQRTPSAYRTALAHLLRLFQTVYQAPISPELWSLINCFHTPTGKES